MKMVLEKTWIFFYESSSYVAFLPVRRLLAQYLQWKDGWLAGCHTPVLCQNGKTYLKPF